MGKAGLAPEIDVNAVCDDNTTAVDFAVLLDGDVACIVSLLVLLEAEGAAVVVSVPTCVDVEAPLDTPLKIEELAIKAISAFPSFKSFFGSLQQPPLPSPSQQ